MSLVASEFPDFVEVAPEFVDEFLCPCVACVFGWSFAVAVVLLLVFDDGVGDLSSEEVLPSDGLLLHGCSKQWVCAREALGAGRVKEPLD